MEAIFPDWNGEGIEAVLHERQGGWAETMKTVENLARLARSKGVRIFEGVEVTGFDLHDGHVRAVETDQGSIATEFFIAGAGPWGGHVWRHARPLARGARRAQGQAHVTDRRVAASIEARRQRHRATRRSRS